MTTNDRDTLGKIILWSVGMFSQYTLYAQRETSWLNTHMHATRNHSTNNLVIPKCNTNSGMRTFHVRAGADTIMLVSY